MNTYHSLACWNSILNRYLTCLITFVLSETSCDACKASVSYKIKISKSILQQTTFATGVVCRQGTLTPWTPGPVPICRCSFVETTATQSFISPPIHDSLPVLTSYRIWLRSWIWHHNFMSLSLVWLLTEFDMTEYRFPWGICNGWSMLTGDAYSLDTWSCPFGTCICLTCKDQSFFRLRYFSGLCSSNIPRHSLDFALLNCRYNVTSIPDHWLSPFVGRNFIF